MVEWHRWDCPDCGEVIVHECGEKMIMWCVFCDAMIPHEECKWVTTVGFRRAGSELIEKWQV